MKTEEIKRWEVVEFRGKRYLRDRQKNEGVLIEIHESHIVSEVVDFIVIFTYASDFNYNRYSSRSIYYKEDGMCCYLFKKRGDALCCTPFL